MISHIAFMLEEDSKTTVENAIYCREIVDGYGCKDVVLVTNEFHMPRAHLIFKSVFKSCTIHCIAAQNGLKEGIEYR